MTVPFSFGARCRLKLCPVRKAKRTLLGCVYKGNGLEAELRVLPRLTGALSDEQHLCRPLLVLP